MHRIKEKNIYDTILSYTAEQWNPLLDLIPQIESHRRFTQDVNDLVDTEEFGTFCYCVPVELINRFQNAVYWMPILIDFEWDRWEDTLELIHEDYFDFDFDTLDIPTKCIIITAIIDLDKSTDYEVIKGKLQNGFILMLLKSIKAQLAI